MNIIKTKVPLSAEQVNNYCLANASGNNDILYDFNITDCPLSDKHILGYLSHLKIDFIITGMTESFLREYVTTDFMVGDSNMVRHHANALMLFVHGKLYDESITTPEIIEWYERLPEDVLERQVEIINSLPLYLVESSTLGDEQKKLIVGNKEYCDLQFEIGVNFGLLSKLDDFFVLLIGDKIFNFMDQVYYDYYFGEYVFAGDRLIYYITENKNNLLFSAIDVVMGQFNAQ